MELHEWPHLFPGPELVGPTKPPLVLWASSFSHLIFHKKIQTFCKDNAKSE